MWPVRKKGHFADKGACYAQVVRKIGHFADKGPCYALAVRKTGHFADKGPCYALAVRKKGHFAKPSPLAPPFGKHPLCNLEANHRDAIWHPFIFPRP